MSHVCPLHTSPREIPESRMKAESVSSDNENVQRENERCLNAENALNKRWDAVVLAWGS